MKITKEIMDRIRRFFGMDEEGRTLGQRVADNFSGMVGSWTFIIIQTSFLLAWLVINIYAITARWDPYPFILLNLFLSFQAAYTGPIIMMSQNRQCEIDRNTMQKDYELSEKIAKILEAHSRDRKRQFKLLKEILEEVEHDDGA